MIRMQHHSQHRAKAMATATAASFSAAAGISIIGDSMGWLGSVLL